MGYLKRLSWPRSCFVSLLGLLALASCGPVSLEQAERECAARADLATGPRGTVGIGAGSKGVSTLFEVEISSDYLQRRDPAQVYESCVLQRAGQRPQHGLAAVPPRR